MGPGGSLGIERVGLSIGRGSGSNRCLAKRTATIEMSSSTAGSLEAAVC